MPSLLDARGIHGLESPCRAAVCAEAPLASVDLSEQSRLRAARRAIFDSQHFQSAKRPGIIVPFSPVNSFCRAKGPRRYYVGRQVQQYAQQRCSIKYFRDTLKYVKPHKNVTLSLPESLLRRFRIYAASRNQSMTSLMTEAIRTLIEQDEQSAKAKRRFLDRIQNAPDRGTGGKISWTREELHERRIH